MENLLQWMECSELRTCYSESVCPPGGSGNPLEHRSGFSWEYGDDPGFVIPKAARDHEAFPPHAHYSCATTQRLSSLHHISLGHTNRWKPAGSIDTTDIPDLRIPPCQTKHKFRDPVFRADHYTAISTTNQPLTYGGYRRAIEIYGNEYKLQSAEKSNHFNR